ncbi:MAG: carbohydrate-binding domain-containing protein [Prevotella sp.]|nr:carbohydrate-binding domain-containing protein [Prevotella sp.]
MKKIYAFISCLVVAIATSAQTLNVKEGNVVYQFPSSQTGEMTFADGTTLTVMGKTFTLANVSMTVDETTVTDNQVTVVYGSSSAEVYVAGNVAQYLTVEQSGAHVSITQSSDVADEITYTLSGTSSDGEFYMAGSYKSTIVLNGLTLTNTTPVYSGAAIHIQNGKRINIKLTEGTTNTLTDATSGSQKGCLYVKGHAEFKQKGTLNVVGNLKHGIKAGEYITVKNATINVTSAAGDGINCTQYFQMESGTVSISGTSDDGIQCDIDDTETGSTGETTDHEDEDSGNIYLEGGTITVNCSATAAKGIKGEGDMIVSGSPVVNVTTTGNGEWDDDDEETKAACGMSSDGNITIGGGTLTLTATGAGGKGMKCDGVLTVTDGSITVKTSGGLYYNNGSTENTNYTGNTDNVSSDYYSSPKGIKVGLKTESGNSYTYSGGIVISGGTISVTTSGYNAEGIESKNTLYITGGTVTVNSYDDGINSAKEMYLQGGTITVVASANDAIDSNANLYISGGTIVACGASGAECGIDAAEGYSVYVTGGSLLAIGGSNNGVSSTSGSQCVLSTSGSVSANSSVTVKNGSTTLASFTVPSGYSSSSSSGMGGPGGGNNGSNVLISCSGLSSGTSYTVTLGSTSNSVTASTTSSDSMGGGGGPGGR